MKLLLKHFSEVSAKTGLFEIPHLKVLSQPDQLLR